METDIAHDRTDDGILFEPAFGLQFHGAEEHDLVAVHVLSLSSTARQRSASPSLAMPMSAPYFKTVSFRLSRLVEPQFSFDVDAVRLVMDGNDFCPQPFKDFRA